ncbi:MutS-related protein [Dyella sp. A6]|uniref:MutS-related protein n=1 Tax=Dyella aluminiiresistens TaxID=3069105 RepID=UPI002E75E576|nr:hypothetical protein [Dyella sp. A6]
MTLLPKWLAYPNLDALFPWRRALTALREQWGRPGSKNEPSAARYFRLVRGNVVDACVDDKTWDDLEYPGLFLLMDTTVTPLGSQVLFRRMREYIQEPEPLAARYTLYRQLHENVALRERIQLKLMPLKEPEHGRIADALLGDELAMPPHRGLIYLWSLLSVAVLAASIAWSWPVWIWCAMLAVNGVVLYRSYWSTLRDIHTLKGCVQMLRVADTLASLHAAHPWCTPLVRLHELRGHRVQAGRALLPMALLKYPIVSYVAVWLNLAFLLELVVHLRSVTRFYRMRERLVPIFEALGEIDAAIATASFLASRPVYCQPQVVEQAQLEIEAGEHPLLAKGIANTIRLDRCSLLVTGSNMAGKTTFVKMVGMNAILGRTLGFCLAARAVLPTRPVMAAIHGMHSVASGKSHYFAEIEAIHVFLDKAAQAQGGLFVIDEPFSGTNTVERVAIARAVLERLGEASLVLVTTHDIELQDMLGAGYTLCHFQEDPEVNGFFDYRLRPGPATARNAIRLLARVDFPGDVVTRALAYAGAGAAT